MIISSTADSIVAGYDLAVYLPEPAINLEANKIVSVNRTISGGASVSVWAADIAGLTIEPEFTVDIVTLAKLHEMKSTNIDEWLIRTQGKIYVAIYDLISVVRQQSRSDKYRVKIKLVILSEETSS